MLTENDVRKALANKIFTYEAVPALERFLGQEYDPSERTNFNVGEIPTSQVEIILSGSQIFEINYSSGMSWTAKSGRSWTKIH